MVFESSGLTIQIVNVVSTLDIGQEVDLPMLNRFTGWSYDPQKYNGKVAYVKSARMRGKVSLFSSGKMISYGTKSEEDSFRDLQLVTRFLGGSKLIHDFLGSPTVRNIVASVYLGNKIDLERIVSRNSSFIYEPEIFPGAIYRPKSLNGISILLFASGKAVIAGARNQLDIKTSIEKVISLLE